MDGHDMAWHGMAPAARVLSPLLFPWYLPIHPSLSTSVGYLTCSVRGRQATTSTLGLYLQLVSPFPFAPKDTVSVPEPKVLARDHDYRCNCYCYRYRYLLCRRRGEDQTRPAPGRSQLTSAAPDWSKGHYENTSGLQIEKERR